MSPYGIGGGSDIILSHKAIAASCRLCRTSPVPVPVVQAPKNDYPGDMEPSSTFGEWAMSWPRANAKLGMYKNW
jgi:hypothetical protein